MHHLSQTSMGTYERCPQMWKLHYVDRHPTKPNRFLNLGSAVHAALETLYQRRISEPATLDEMIEAFDAEIDPAAYANEEELGRARADGLQMIRGFTRPTRRASGPRYWWKASFASSSRGCRSSPRSTGSTRSTGPETARLRNSRASGSSTTSPASRRRTSTKCAGAISSPSTRLPSRPSSDSRSRRWASTTSPPRPLRGSGPRTERVDELRRRVVRIARAIESEEFEPRPGRPCDWCDFKAWCPAWAHEYPQNWQQEPLPPVPSHADAGRLVNQYGEIKDEIEPWSPSWRRRASRWSASSRRRGSVPRRRSLPGEATFCTGYRFDDEELRPLLESAGLWEKVLIPDWRAEELCLPTRMCLPRSGCAWRRWRRRKRAGPFTTAPSRRRLKAGDRREHD